MKYCKWSLLVVALILAGGCSTPPYNAVTKTAKVLWILIFLLATRKTCLAGWISPCWRNRT